MRFFDSLVLGAGCGPHVVLAVQYPSGSWRTWRTTARRFGEDCELRVSSISMFPKKKRKHAEAQNLETSMKSKPSPPYENQVIARQMRDNVDATDLLALDIYDTAFKKRQELWTPAGWKLFWCGNGFICRYYFWFMQYKLSIHRMDEWFLYHSNPFQVFWRMARNFLYLIMSRPILAPFAFAFSIQALNFSDALVYGFGPPNSQRLNSKTEIHQQLLLVAD